MRIAPKPKNNLVTLEGIIYGPELDNARIKAPAEKGFPDERFFLIERDEYFTLGSVDVRVGDGGVTATRPFAFDVGKRLLPESCMRPNEKYDPREFRPPNAPEFFAILAAAYMNRMSRPHKIQVEAFQTTIGGLWKEAIFLSALSEIEVKPKMDKYFVTHYDPVKTWKKSDTIPKEDQFYASHQIEDGLFGVVTLMGNHERMFDALMDTQNFQRALLVWKWMTGSTPSLYAWAKDKPPTREFPPLFFADRIICDPAQKHTYSFLQIRRYDLGGQK